MEGAGIAMPVRVDRGLCYLVRERRPTASFRLFRRLLEDSMPGLCISRLHPSRLSRRYGLSSPTVRLWWLAEAPGEGHYSARQIVNLAAAIQRFVDENGGRAVVLVDGLEHLIQVNSFRETLLAFVEHLNEFVMAREAVLLFPLSPMTLTPTDLANLERNLEVLDGDDLNRRFDADDLVGGLE